MIIVHYLHPQYLNKISHSVIASHEPSWNRVLFREQLKTMIIPLKRQIGTSRLRSNKRSNPSWWRKASLTFLWVPNPWTLRWPPYQDRWVFHETIRMIPGITPTQGSRRELRLQIWLMITFGDLKRNLCSVVVEENHAIIRCILRQAYQVVPNLPSKDESGATLITTRPKRESVMAACLACLLIGASIVW